MNAATQDMGLMADGAFTALGPKQTEATIFIWPPNILMVTSGFSNGWSMLVDKKMGVVLLRSPVKTAGL